MSPEEVARRLLEEARRCNHRRMLVLSEPRESGIGHIRTIWESVRDVLENGVLFSSKPDVRIDGLEVVELKYVDDYLGTTYPFVAVDFHRSFIPNDLGKLVGIVRGGGLLVLLFPPREVFFTRPNFFHEVILTPPYTLEDVRHNLARWVWRKILEHRGIAVFEGEKLVSRRRAKCAPRKGAEIKRPHTARFPTLLYDMCLTQDQVNVLGDMEALYSGGVYVLTSDRGRGKSSVLGIGAAGMVHLLGKKASVVVTAPSPKNVRELFRFAAQALERMGYKPRTKERGGCVVELRAGNRVIAYHPPSRAAEMDADMTLVDEAGGIPVPLLFALLKTSRRVAYSSTVHGYEGTGRSFTIRFLQALRETQRDLITRKMEEPIRYGPDDPIEEWIFDTLLLNAEPPEIEKVGPLKYVRRDIEDLMNDEEKLREYYGIFVLAHYRNNPNDFGIICDAPNQEIRYMESDGKVVCSVQLAREGGLTGDIAEEMYYGRFPPGNVIPDIFIKHYRDLRFPALRGYRIVRIATHPKHWGRGIGSAMLREICREDVDWVGSVFGATPSLLRFWTRNGFAPVHVSPSRNETTGEYSVAVIKPLTKDARKIVREARKRFAERFIVSLMEIHRDMEVDIAHEILRASYRHLRSPPLDEVEWKRLVAYAYGPGTYEGTQDVLHRLAASYFVLKDRPELTEEQERIFIAKVLQGKTWNEVAREIHRGPTYTVIELREAVRRIIEGYGVYEDEVSEFRERFHRDDS